MDDIALTTTDNPYNPFTHFDEWFAFDTQSGYNTCGYLASLARTSNDLSDEENEIAIEEAMQEIVDLNVSGKHKIVTPNDFKQKTA